MRRRRHASRPNPKDMVSETQVEGPTTTPFEIVVLNDPDQFHLVGDVIDRMPGLSSQAAYTKQYLRDRFLDHRACIRKHGEDMPGIRNWRWSLDKGSK